MVAEQIARRGLMDERLLCAFEKVPRHLFVSKVQRYRAYDDRPLTIGYGQTISQPYIVALMTDLLKLKGNERVLDVGTGSGYQAAILSHMVNEVHSIEVIPELYNKARKLLEELELQNVYCHLGDGSTGWQGAAPFGGIVVAAAAPETPQSLLNQLEEGGRLVVPVGGQGIQQLELWQRDAGVFKHQVITGVAFVPLRGQEGWGRDAW